MIGAYISPLKRFETIMEKIFAYLSCTVFYHFSTTVPLASSLFSSEIYMYIKCVGFFVLTLLYFALTFLFSETVAQRKLCYLLGKFK